MSRTVIITGASSGIGFALAESYLSAGFNVVGNGRSQERLHDAAKKLGNPDNFLAVEGDIAAADTSDLLFGRAISHFGKVDILVNNAGIFIAKPITSYTTDDLDMLIDTNLRGFFYPTQAAAAHMIENGGGHIVNITAVVGIQPNANVPATLPALMKGGINQATRSLATELAKHKIKVNAVAPGVIDTPLHNPEKHAFLATLNPFGRLGQIKEIVDAVRYLTDADFTTGVILPVDGGAAAGR
ncbi:SDR family NAD(P)-dependent oxidoreductase [Paraburkholderia lycopersici]|uniref:NAD(P)-dependent dehydrogenase, short-chain alcohol dehydrogenase family n=1 Tax=Paraburkholderia lycopersici TaxID=416944 RepID=A0A1G6UIT1_9BURK|nr:SDR family oxidoreductase [Paraburkholderia lycopersici]SDD41164.1 NAD(P)-dependent dehydrogenase, short-chain alcohol dehydrogenase family [Paraburkholderia lycopersici]